MFRQLHFHLLPLVIRTRPAQFPLLLGPNLYLLFTVLLLRQYSEPWLECLAKSVTRLSVNRTCGFKAKWVPQVTLCAQLIVCNVWCVLQVTSVLVSVATGRSYIIAVLDTHNLSVRLWFCAIKMSHDSNTLNVFTDLFQYFACVLIIFLKYLVIGM